VCAVGLDLGSPDFRLSFPLPVFLLLTLFSPAQCPPSEACSAQKRVPIPVVRPTFRLRDPGNTTKGAFGCRHPLISTAVPIILFPSPVAFRFQEKGLTENFFVRRRNTTAPRFPSSAGSPWAPKEEPTYPGSLHLPCSLPQRHLRKALSQTPFLKWPFSPSLRARSVLITCHLYSPSETSGFKSPAPTFFSRRCCSCKFFFSLTHVPLLKPLTSVPVLPAGNTPL